MKQFCSLIVLLVALGLQSCQNNLNLPSPTSRNYQQDIAVLNDFVDINKTTHGYYINPSFEWSANQGNDVNWNFEVTNMNGDAHIANLNFLH